MVIVTPRELDEKRRSKDALDDLLHEMFLRGTPSIFPTHAQYCAFLRFVSGKLKVHTQNICIRGSGWLGFSLTPDNDKVWCYPTPTSDVDVALVDSIYYDNLEFALRQWESELKRLPSKVFLVRKWRQYF